MGQRARNGSGLMWQVLGAFLLFCGILLGIAGLAVWFVSKLFAPRFPL